MKIWAGITGEGISLRIGGSELPRLEASASANQVNPRRCYVYAHYDERGTPFYIGKGVLRRAWDDARHPLWHRYVERHLGGKYTVRILKDDLSPEQAEELESEWIAQESETLINWINFGRKTDFDALEKYHSLRNANRELIAGTRTLEQSDPERAIATYYRAIANIAAYAKINSDGGLVGRLLDEERQELGYSGEIEALNRLTLCLTRMRRVTEAQLTAEKYFAAYEADQQCRSAVSVKKRIAKAIQGGG